MVILPVSSEELEELREVQIRPQWGWPATFSCNEAREVWPFTTTSRTPEEDRLPLDIPFLNRIVELVVAETRAMGKYPQGGRFYVNDVGVFLTVGNVQIVQFEFDDEGFSMGFSRLR